VRNVAQPVIGRAFALYQLPVDAQGDRSRRPFDSGRGTSR
jgi:hypothetical protein